MLQIVHANTDLAQKWYMSTSPIDVEVSNINENRAFMGLMVGSTGLRPTRVFTKPDLTVFDLVRKLVKAHESGTDQTLIAVDLGLWTFITVIESLAPTVINTIITNVQEQVHQPS